MVLALDGFLGNDNGLLGGLLGSDGVDLDGLLGSDGIDTLNYGSDCSIYCSCSYNCPQLGMFTSH